MSFDVITIGSAVVDIFIKSDDFLLHPSEMGTLLCQKYGDKVELDYLQLHSGGGASNTAAGFVKMGFATSTICELGKDMWTQFVVSDLDKAKIDTSLLIKERKEQTGGSIIMIGEDGGRTVMVHRGASSMLNPKDIDDSNLSSCRWVHLTNIAGQLETLKAIFKTVNDNPTKMSWNPGKAELEMLISGQLKISDLPVEIFIINKEEWQIVEKLKDQLTKKFPMIVVTNGKEGGFVLAQDQEISYQAEYKKTIDETGAGDAFCVGFISAYLHHQPLEICLDWGKRNAASVVTYIGAKDGLLSKREIEIS